MIRTFIAVELDPDMKRSLARDVGLLSAAAPRVKWSRPDNLHLTLRFLGDVKENDLQELFDALQEGVSGLSPFAMAVEGLGVFPNWRHPRVVWAGCGEGADDAVRLADAVEEAVTGLGYERENRPFQPHFTLGRVKMPADADGLESAVERMGARKYGFLDVDEAVVFMSTLRRTGPVYSPMFRVRLNGDGSGDPRESDDR